MSRERKFTSDHMTKMAATPMYGKTPLKIFFSGTKGPMALGLGMQHWDCLKTKILTLGCP